MIFKYNELKQYVAKDFDRFFQMGFNDNQIFFAILDEYQYGEEFSLTENICIHLISAIKYKEYNFNNENIVQDLKKLMNGVEYKELQIELGKEYDYFYEDLNAIY